MVCGSLGFGDSSVRAGAFAGAAVDALVGVDHVGIFSFGDGAHRAYVGAGGAGHTKVGVDLSRHNFDIFLIVVVFSRLRR